jgi:ABC-2 type transport system ATP-binding protein
MSDPIMAIVAEGLRKRFGETLALDGFDLRVPAGTVCGLLGPNGAGKSTAVRILATLLRPDGGRGLVAGFDVSREAAAVRRRIGLIGQAAALDDQLTGRQNLVMFCRLNQLEAQTARRRADELLEQFALTEAADKQARHYSGGMRRRLDLAASFILAPQVLFLDEPTAGLDPRSRNEVWSGIRRLVAGGTTVLLTTQYLDEADQLAHQVVVIDQGKVIAAGTPSQLKSRIGGDQVDVVLERSPDLLRAVAVVATVTGRDPQVDGDTRRISAPVQNRVATLIAVARALDDAGIGVHDIGLRRPTLDEVFLRLTGQHRDQEVAA